MKLRHGVLAVSFTVLGVACGGNAFKEGGEGGSSSGGSGNGGSGNSTSTGGKSGSTSTGGSSGTAGTSGLGGEPGCASVKCAAVDCSADEVPVTKPGDCCQTCEPKAGGCENVKCEPVEECSAGYELARPPGACCEGCVPKVGVACREIACVTNDCPAGYVPGDKVGGCCYDCVPDPLYCGNRDDCVIATKQGQCCACPEAISRRQLQEESCWAEADVGAPVSSACQPPGACGDVVCAPCQTLGKEVDCSDNRCIARGFGLK
jgi:hypothetical protein